MLRIVFTPDDLLRIRIAADPDPMWETVLSVFRLRRPGPAPIFGRWRHHALGSIRRDDLDLLRPLIQGRYFPDFLTPAEGAQGLAPALDALMSTPITRLRAEMTELGEPASPWMRSLADGDVATLTRVAGAIRSQHDAVVAPFRSDARAHIDADRARRARILLDQGAEGLLNSFRPMMRWNPPALELDRFVDRDLHLDGRGLLLIPSYLCWATPDFLRDPSLPPVVVYPVEHEVTTWGERPVAALIGRTRTVVLESIGDGSTTTDLARRVGVSPAAISQHTAVLREARLIHTTRVGKAVLHTMTPLGRALLDRT